ncbi:MAG: MBL fold metallo-hydrolase [Gemmatimonadetes bacterium]|nr:MBL fold metallo-hydrolase [Gemmatimonadota bacterium]
MKPELAPHVIALSLALGTAPLVAQEVEVQTVQVTDSVYMLMGRGGNIGLSVGKDGAFLIDDQYAPMVPRIRAAVAMVSSQPVNFLINTHWHGDHTGGNERFGRAGAIIVAHENVRKRLNADQFQEALSRSTPPSPSDALPIVTFNDTVTFHWNGDEIRVFHVQNAHTDGDSIIHFKNANVMHAGDTFFKNAYPFVDISSGGNFDGVIAVAKQLLEIADDETKIIPGHGTLATKADLQTYVEVLSTIRSRVVRLIEEGKTEDQVVEANPTAQWDATWGQGFMGPERWTRIIYQSLSASRE